MLKKQIRKKMLEIRNNIVSELKKHKDKKIASSFIELLMRRKTKSVLLYASFGSEVDTWTIFDYCIDSSIKTAFPKVKGRDLELYWIERPEQLDKGYKSILEPVEGIPANLQEIDLIVVPGIAFDTKCFRIGYGEGFYDRLLSVTRALAVGLAYEEQIIDEIPIEPFDKKVDLIITDERMISCV